MLRMSISLEVLLVSLHWVLTIFSSRRSRFTWSDRNVVTVNGTREQVLLLNPILGLAKHFELYGPLLQADNFGLSRFPPSLLHCHSHD